MQLPKRIESLNLKALYLFKEFQSQNNNQKHENLEYMHLVAKEIKLI